MKNLRNGALHFSFFPRQKARVVLAKNKMGILKNARAFSWILISNFHIFFFFFQLVENVHWIVTRLPEV